jgi:hypothetical protein
VGQIDNERRVVSGLQRSFTAWPAPAGPQDRGEVDDVDGEDDIRLVDDTTVAAAVLQVAGGQRRPVPVVVVGRAEQFDQRGEGSGGAGSRAIRPASTTGRSAAASAATARSRMAGSGANAGAGAYNLASGTGTGLASRSSCTPASRDRYAGPRGADRARCRARMGPPANAPAVIGRRPRPRSRELVAPASWPVDPVDRAALAGSADRCRRAAAAASVTPRVVDRHEACGGPTRSWMAATPSCPVASPSRARARPRSLVQAEEAVARLPPWLTTGRARRNDDPDHRHLTRRVDESTTTSLLPRRRAPAGAHLGTPRQRSSRHRRAAGRAAARRGLDGGVQVLREPRWVFASSALIWTREWLATSPPAPRRGLAAAPRRRRGTSSGHRRHLGGDD